MACYPLSNRLCKYLILFMLVIVTSPTSEAKFAVVWDTIPAPEEVDSLYSGIKQANGSLAIGILSMITAPAGLLLATSSALSSPAIFIIGIISGLGAIILSAVAFSRNQKRKGAGGNSNRRDILVTKRRAVTGTLLGTAGMILGIILTSLYVLYY